MRLECIEHDSRPPAERNSAPIMTAERPEAKEFHPRSVDRRRPAMAARGQEEPNAKLSDREGPNLSRSPAEIRMAGHGATGGVGVRKPVPLLGVDPAMMLRCWSSQTDSRPRSSVDM
jgi:hypothetical protein